MDLSVETNQAAQDVHSHMDTGAPTPILGWFHYCLGDCFAGRRARTDDDNPEEGRTPPDDAPPPDPPSASGAKRGSPPIWAQDATRKKMDLGKDADGAADESARAKAGGSSRQRGRGALPKEVMSSVEEDTEVDNLLASKFDRFDLEVGDFGP